MVGLLCGFILVGASGVGQSKHSVDFRTLKNGGVVPDAATARAIAEAVWNPIYGKDRIRRQMPCRVRLRGEVWIVQGTLHDPIRASSPLSPGIPVTRMRGGTAYAEIAKFDGRILRITHGK